MIELIPAIDLIKGRCVRLLQGAFEHKTVYSDQPLEIARRFEDMGITRLHIVDLDGARKGHVVNLGILEQISRHTGLIIDFGGGVKSTVDLRRVFEAGAAMVTAGSIAIRDPVTVESWLREYGPERIILGADVRDHKLAVNAWQENTALDLFEFIGGYIPAGLKKVICTDITRDGTLKGPSMNLFKDLKHRYPELDIIASGGVSDIKDIFKLEKTGVKGVIFGKAFYEGRIRAKDIIKYINQ